MMFLPPMHQFRTVFSFLKPALHSLLKSRRVRRLGPALLALVIASGLFVDNVFLAPGRASEAQALALAERIRADDVALRAWLRELNSPAPQAAETVPPARNDVLRKLNALAQASDARLMRIAPLPNGRSPIQIEAEARFVSLVELIGQLEARGGVVHHLQVQPARSDGAGGPAVAALFNLDWPAGMREPAQLASLARHLAASAGSADPFRLFPDRSGTSLRTGHFLSGITSTSGETFATIDGQDYRVGDPIGTGTLTAIRTDAVQLSSGSAHSWLYLGAR